MFGLFDSKPLDDPQLGRFTRSGGRWKGSCALQKFGKSVLLLSGSNKGPDQNSLVLARELPVRFEVLVPSIKAALLEHRSADPESPDSKDATPTDVWEHVVIERILIEPMRGVPTIEIALRVAWDEEYTLGARIQSWQLTELSGSILMN